jgi:hypothetical protein
MRNWRKRCGKVGKPLQLQRLLTEEKNMVLIDELTKLQECKATGRAFSEEANGAIASLSDCFTAMNLETKAEMSGVGGT